MKRELLPENSIIVFILGFVVCQIAGIIVSFFADKTSDAYLFCSYALPQVAYIVVTAVYVKATKTDFRFLPEKKDVKPIHYLMAFCLGTGIFFFALLPNYGLQKLFTFIGKNPTVDIPDLTSPLNVVLGVIIICLLPSVGEELVFRKIFNDGFSAYGQTVSILLSGFLFGISHLNLAQTVHQIFLGVILSYIYVKTKNLTLTSLIHFINNLLALFLPRFTGAELWNNITVLGVSFAAGSAIMALSLIYFIKKTPKINNQKQRKISYFTIGFSVFMFLLWLVAAIII